jgi:hypothetical protein
MKVLHGYSNNQMQKTGFWVCFLAFDSPPASDLERSKHVHQLTTGSFTVNTLPEPTLESKEICP